MGCEGGEGVKKSEIGFGFGFGFGVGLGLGVGFGVWDWDIGEMATHCEVPRGSIECGSIRGIEGGRRKRRAFRIRKMRLE